MERSAKARAQTTAKRAPPWLPLLPLPLLRVLLAVMAGL